MTFFGGYAPCKGAEKFFKESLRNKEVFKMCEVYKRTILQSHNDRETQQHVVSLVSAGSALGGRDYDTDWWRKTKGTWKFIEKGHVVLLYTICIHIFSVSVGPASEWGGCCFGRTSHLGPGSGGGKLRRQTTGKFDRNLFVCWKIHLTARWMFQPMIFLRFAESWRLPIGSWNEMKLPST